MSDSKKGRRSTVQIVEDYLEANEYMKEGDVYFVLKKELYGESASGFWKDREYFVNHEKFEKLQSETSCLKLEQLSLSDFDLFQVQQSSKTQELEKQISDLQAENTDLKRRLEGLEKMGESFLVLYSSRAEVEAMIAKISQQQLYKAEVKHMVDK